MIVATAVAGTIALAITAGCGGGGRAGATMAAASSGTTMAQRAGAVPARHAAAAGARLVKVRSGLGDALAVTGVPGRPGVLFVVQQSGKILVLDHGRLLRRPFLDVTGQIVSGGERGLLGLTLHPGYAGNGRFYVNFTNRSGDTRIVEYRRASANRADPRSARVLLKVSQPFANHKGGGLQFGPDGLLYIGLGDGGSERDPNHIGQNTDTLLGKLLRIDVNRRSPGRPYGIPPGNPFVHGGGLPEIFAYGLRNPWRFSFDRARGDLWIGDVGQDRIEEIDYLPRGAGAGTNFGWSAFEGTDPYHGGTSGLKPGSRHTPPVAEYTHQEGGCAVIGGVVDRAPRAGSLRGRYLLADYCSGKVWSMRAGPRPRGMRQETTLGPRLSSVTSFGEGLNGDVYLVAGGTLYRFAG